MGMKRQKGNTLHVEWPIGRHLSESWCRLNNAFTGSRFGGAYLRPTRPRLSTLRMRRQLRRSAMVGGEGRVPVAPWSIRTKQFIRKQKGRHVLVHPV